MSSGALQSFLIELELTGGKAVVKGIQEVEKAEEGLKNKTENTSKSFGGLKDVLAKTAGNNGLGGFLKYARASIPALAGLAAAGIALKTVLHTVNFAKQAEDLLFMANSAGVAADKMQALALAGEAAGGTRQGAAATAANINQQFEALAKNRGEGTGVWQAAKEYGISFTDAKTDQLLSLDKYFENIARIFAKWNRELSQGDALRQQIAVKNIIGIDDGTFRNLQKGVNGWRASLAQAEQNRLFGKDDEDKIKEFNNQLRLLKQHFTQISGKVAIDLLPTLTEFVKMIGNFKDKEGVRDFLSGFAETFILAVDVFILGLDKTITAVKKGGELLNKGSSLLWESMGGGSLDAEARKNLGAALSKAPDIIAAADTNPLNAAKSGTFSNLIQQQRLGDITVMQSFNGTQSPQEVKTATKDGINEAFSQLKIPASAITAVAG